MFPNFLTGGLFSPPGREGGPTFAFGAKNLPAESKSLRAPRARSISTLEGTKTGKYLGLQRGASFGGSKKFSKGKETAPRPVISPYLVGATCNSIGSTFTNMAPLSDLSYFGEIRSNLSWAMESLFASYRQREHQLFGRWLQLEKQGVSSIPRLNFMTESNDQLRFANKEAMCGR